MYILTHQVEHYTANCFEFLTGECYIGFFLQCSQFLAKQRLAQWCIDTYYITKFYKHVNEQNWTVTIHRI